MGAACCVAARPYKPNLYNDRPLVACPETLSYIWDDKSQTEDVTGPAICMDIQRDLSINGRGSRAASPSATSQRQNLSRNISVDSTPSDSFRTPQWLNSPILTRHDGNFVNATSDSILSTHISEMSSNEGFSASGPSLNPHIAESFPPLSNTIDGVPRQSKSQPSRAGWFKSRSASWRSSFFSRNSHHASNNNLAGEPSQIRIHAPDLVNSSSMAASDGRRSFKLAGSSFNSTMTSRSVSDRWSMQTFSDLVASSRKERFRWSDAASSSDCGWVPCRESMDGDSLLLGKVRANNLEAPSLSSQVEVQTCAICSRNLPYNSEYMAYINDLSVVAVLFCGHVYHAECLEKITPEVSRHDPSCPICIGSEEIFSKHLAYPAEQVTRSKGGFLKAFRSKSQSSTRNKTSKRVANDDIVGPEFFSGEVLLSSKEPLSSDNVLSSSAIEKHPLNKLFFGRHFSLRGKSRK